MTPWISEEDTNALLKEIIDAEMALSNILKELQDRAGVEILGVQMHTTKSATGRNQVTHVTIECERKIKEGFRGISLRFTRGDTF